MKSFVFTFALLLISYVNGGLPKFITESKWFKETDEKLNDWLIKHKVPEKFISKKLPPDWIPNENPALRTPESQKKWEQMEKERKALIF